MRIARQAPGPAAADDAACPASAELSPDMIAGVPEDPATEAERFREFWARLTEGQRAVLVALRRGARTMRLHELHAASGRKSLQGFAVHFTNLAAKAAAFGFAERGIVVRRALFDASASSMSKRTVVYESGRVLSRRLSSDGEPL